MFKDLFTDTTNLLETVKIINVTPETKEGYNNEQI